MLLQFQRKVHLTITGPYPSLAFVNGYVIFCIIKFLVRANFFFPPGQHGFLKGLFCDTKLVLFINDMLQH